MEQQALWELIQAAIEYQKVIRETVDDCWDESGRVRLLARWRLQKAALGLPAEGGQGIDDGVHSRPNGAAPQVDE